MDVYATLGSDHQLTDWQKKFVSLCHDNLANTQEIYRRGIDDMQTCHFLEIGKRVEAFNTLCSVWWADCDGPLKELQGLADPTTWRDASFMGDWANKYSVSVRQLS